MDIQYIHSTQRFWKGVSEKGRWVKSPSWVTSSHCLYLCGTSARIVSSLSTADHLETLWPNHTRSPLPLVSKRSSCTGWCVFLSHCYAYMAIVVSVYLCSEFYYCGDTGAQHTGVDFSQHSPHLLLTANVCHFILSSALVLRSSISSLEAVSCKVESLFADLAAQTMYSISFGRSLYWSITCVVELWMLLVRWVANGPWDLLSVCCVWQRTSS